MADAAPEETAAAVREASGATESQLRRWRREGLLPRPRQRGQGQGRGTTSLYPAGTIRQVIALQAMLRQKRSLDDACWQLWWQGFPVSEERLRKLFREQLSYLAKLRERVAEHQEAEESSALEQAVEPLQQVRLHSPVAARMRRRSSKKKFPDLVYRLFEAASGHTSASIDEEDAATLARAFGIGGPREFRWMLPRVAEGLDPTALQEAFELASRKDLASARDEVQTVFGLVGSLTAFLEAVAGRSLGAALHAELNPPPMNVGLHLVLLWLNVRRWPRVREVYPHMLQAIRKGETGELPLQKALQADLTRGSSEESQDA